MPPCSDYTEELACNYYSTRCMYDYFSSQCLNLGLTRCVVADIHVVMWSGRGLDGMQHILEQCDGVRAEPHVCVQRQHVLELHDDMPQHDAVLAADAECLYGTDGSMHVQREHVLGSGVLVCDGSI